MNTAPRFSYLLLVAVPVALAAVPPCWTADEAPVWGGVKGRIVWDGKAILEAEAEVVDKDKAHCLEKGPIRSEQWVINKENKGVRWVFVWLVPPENTKKLPVHPSLAKIAEKEVTIDQPYCVFVPHALAVREGQDLLVKNSSPVAHTVRWAGPPTQPAVGTRAKNPRVGPFSTRKWARIGVLPHSR